MLTLLLALHLVSGALADDSPTPVAECKSSSECAVISGTCPGTWESVLKTNASAMQTKNLADRSDATCTPPPPGGPGPTPKPLCVSGRCRLVRLSNVDTRDVVPKAKHRIKHPAPLALPSPNPSPDS